MASIACLVEMSLYLLYALGVGCATRDDVVVAVTGAEGLPSWIKLTRQRHRRGRRAEAAAHSDRTVLVSASVQRLLISCLYITFLYSADQWVRFVWQGVGWIGVRRDMVGLRL